MGKEPLFKQQHWPAGLKSGCPAILSHSTKIWFKAVLGSVCLAEGRGAPWNVVWKTDAECWRGWLAEVGHREWSLLLDAGASDDESASRNTFQGELFFMEPVSVHAQLLSWVWLFVTPVDRGTHQAPLSMGFFRQKYWDRLPFPPPGDLPDPRDWTCVSYIGKRILKPSGKPLAAWSYLDTLPNTPPPKEGFSLQESPFLVQLLSHIWLLCSPMDCSPPSSSVHGSYPTAGPELLHKDRWRQDIAHSALWSDKYWEQSKGNWLHSARGTSGSLGYN